jgi:hypothetical protein
MLCLPFCVLEKKGEGGIHEKNGRGRKSGDTSTEYTKIEVEHKEKKPKEVMGVALVLPLSRC